MTTQPNPSCYRTVPVPFLVFTYFFMCLIQCFILCTTCVCFVHFYSKLKRLRVLICQMHTCTGSLRVCVCTCDKTTQQKSGLTYLLSDGTNDKPFPCEFCEKRFRSKKAWNNHRNSHLEGRTLCPHCLKVFSTVSNLRSHVFLKHGMPPLAL
jgi:hypothetical protein